MANTNYITSIVKILEVPKQRLFNKTILITEFRAFLPQIKDSKVINLVIWGDFSHRLSSYIKPNDYILIEGFLAVSNRENSKRKKFTVTVLKTYPIFSSSTGLVSKI